MRYSESTGCFYPESFSYPDLPSDVITIPQADFELAMNRKPDEDYYLKDGKIKTKKKPSSPTPVPTTVTMCQARLALLSVGLLHTVEDLIVTMPEAVWIEWRFRPEVQRDHGFFSEVIPLLGLSEKEVDDLFILAAGL